MSDSTVISAITEAGRRSLKLGIGFGVLAVIGAVLNPAAFYQAYLIGYLFWLAIALGSLITLMIHHVAGGAWLCVIRRPMEAAIRTLPLLALLFIPILLGMSYLYPWSVAEVVAEDYYLQFKAPYLNTTFFVIRAVIYFAVWCTLGHFLVKWSQEQDRTGDPMLNKSMRVVSGGGIVAYVLTTTFASFDWMMSVDPHWFSSIYGPIFMVSQGLGALCFLLIVVVLLARFEPLSKVVTQDRYHDLGKWLFALVMLWAYMMFSQFLIIWSGNLPEHIAWYLRRTDTDWKVLALILTIFHFFVPFIVLLSRLAKKRAGILIKLAIGLLVLRLFDLFWLLAPDLHDGAFVVHWLDLVVPVALGGVWLALYTKRLGEQSLVVLNDPRFPAKVLQGGGDHD